ncbi:MAG: ATP-dependent DNA helicase, partial [Caldimonas sp.]
TGVGKTFAYLVPALLSGARTLLSTATKNLQDQLFLRDLPRLRDALKLPLRVALLKGRGSYLCLHRLGQARQSAQLPDRFAARALAKIETWAQSTTSGDLAELAGLDERSSVIALVTSSRENCLGSDCPEHRACHVNKARREAMASDLVVVNHHLFFADMALRDSGVAELLPSVEVAIFDEAHQLGEAGIQFLGTVLGSSQLIDFARDLLACGLQQARGLAAWQDTAAACDRAARELRLAAAGERGEGRVNARLRWSDRSSAAAFVAALADVKTACTAARAAAESCAELAPDFARLAERAGRLGGLAERFTEPAADAMIRWIDVSAHQVRLVESPLDIRDALREGMAASPKAWIFTSATLGDDDRLSWFTEPAGLEAARAMRLGSPFDYAAHARIFVPRVFAKPGEPGHPRAVAGIAARCASALGGRTFVLTTTLRSLQTVGAELVLAFEAAGESIEVLVQGQGSKRQLMERFLVAPHAVLVGSQSFWEGVDVPGEALQCVVIDKLPFPPPGDPLVEARVKRLEADGRNPFADYFVAEAAVSLKQGAGRLIRSETDRGLLVVCDPRLATMGYGRRLLGALPPMRRVADESEALAWLGSLRDEPALA